MRTGLLFALFAGIIGTVVLITLHRPMLEWLYAAGSQELQVPEAEVSTFVTILAVRLPLNVAQSLITGVLMSTGGKSWTVVCPTRRKHAQLAQCTQLTGQLLACSYAEGRTVHTVRLHACRQAWWHGLCQHSEVLRASW